MIAAQNIHPPKNWQDFEMLCLKLWGELWNVPDEIDFNSDNAQGQQGVDIYAPVEGGLKYHGIQCKNKKLNLIDGSPNRITTADIQIEIEKAKTFQPALAKLVIATSLGKDQQVEEYVRIQSVANVAGGLFSIQICFWDYFERKLPEHPKIYDWYLKNENFHRIGSASVAFSGGSVEVIYNPKFQKSINRYVLKPQPEIDPYILLTQRAITNDEYLRRITDRGLMGVRQPVWTEKLHDWHQNFWFRLNIRNTGQRVIEHFKLELDFDGDFIKVGPESASGMFADRFSTDVYGYSNADNSLYIRPDKSVLVQGDNYTTSSIFLKPELAKRTEIRLFWKLLAKDFEDEGELLIKIEPLVYHVITEHFVANENEVREESNFGFIQRPKNMPSFDGRSWFTDDDSKYVCVPFEG